MKIQAGIVIDDGRKVRVVHSCAIAIAMLRSGYDGDFWTRHEDEVLRQRLTLRQEGVANGLARC